MWASCEQILLVQEQSIYSELSTFLAPLKKTTNFPVIHRILRFELIGYLPKLRIQRKHLLLWKEEFMGSPCKILVVYMIKNQKT